MSLSDLTGTTWQLNSSLVSYAAGTYSLKTYSVNITTAEPVQDGGGGDPKSSFTSIWIGYNSGPENNEIRLDPGDGAYILAQGHDTKSLPDSWLDYVQGAFTITGGTDATNSTLIAWVEGNCTSYTPPTPDITVTYEGDAIAELYDSGTKTFRTAGKYLTDDLTLEYSKSGGSTGTIDVSISESAYGTISSISWVDDTGEFRSDYEEVVGASDMYATFTPAIGSMFVVSIGGSLTAPSIWQATLSRTLSIGSRPTVKVLFYMVTG